MFTGIIAQVGKIDNITPKQGDMRLTINTGDWDISEVALGDSICVNGVCLTAVELHENAFVADVSNESMQKTILGEAVVGTRVNLEMALRLSDRLGGHIVSGHVDGIGHVTERYQESRSWRFVVRAPKELVRYIAPKGSITINGISLTVNDVNEDQFDVNIVPHTFDCTTMSDLNVGSAVNLEIDLLARYLEKLLSSDEVKDYGVSKDLLQKSGFWK